MMANPENETSKLLKNSEKTTSTQMSTPPPYIGACTPMAGPYIGACTLMGPPPYRRPNSDLDFAIHFLNEIKALSERMPAIHLEPSLTNDIVYILP
jgi:hypothetical protein